VVVEAEHATRANLAEQDLKEEIELLEAVLESFTPLVGDTPLLAGLAYCQHRDWTCSSGPPSLEQLSELLHQIRHLGQLERLHLDGNEAASFDAPLYDLPASIGDGRFELSVSSDKDHRLFVFQSSSFDHAPEIFLSKSAGCPTCRFMSLSFL